MKFKFKLMDTKEMYKKTLIFFLSAGLFGGYTNAALADVVILKNGRVIEGTITEKTENYVKIKSSSGTGTFQLDKVSGAVRDKEIPSVIFPDEVYKEKLSKISEKDAKARYELGIFCFGEGLFDEAAKEFNKALELAPKYKEDVEGQLKKIDAEKARILYNCGLFFLNIGETGQGVYFLKKLISAYPENGLAEKANELVLSAEAKRREGIPESLSAKDLQSKLEEGNSPLPKTEEDQKNISLFINGMSNDKKIVNCKKYFEIGKEYQAKVFAEDGSSNDIEGFSSIALYSYRIAAQEESLKSAASLRIQEVLQGLGRNKSYETETATFPIPSPDRKDEVRANIESLGREVGTQIGGRYSLLGDVFINKAKKEDSPEKRKEYLKIAVNCYEIAIDYVKSRLSRALIEANRRQALNELNAIR